MNRSMNSKIKMFNQLIDDGWSPDFARKKSGISYTQFYVNIPEQIQKLKDEIKVKRSKERPRLYSK